MRWPLHLLTLYLLLLSHTDDLKSGNDLVWSGQELQDFVRKYTDWRTPQGTVPQEQLEASVKDGQARFVEDLVRDQETRRKIIAFNLSYTNLIRPMKNVELAMTAHPDDEGYDLLGPPPRVGLYCNITADDEAWAWMNYANNYDGWLKRNEKLHDKNDKIHMANIGQWSNAKGRGEDSVGFTEVAINFYEDSKKLLGAVRENDELLYTMNDETNKMWDDQISKGERRITGGTTSTTAVPKKRNFAAMVEEAPLLQNLLNDTRYLMGEESAPQVDGV